MSVFSLAWFVGILQSAVRMATPYTIAAMGGLYSDKAGVSSIELEGILLMGAFTGFIGTHYTGNLWMGLLISMVAGALLVSIYAFMTVKLGCKQALIGTAIFLLASGLTSFFFQVIFGVSPEFVNITPFQTISIPLLSKIPIIGPIFFEQNVLVYISFGLVAFTWFFYKKLPLGLECRAVGENPHAADTVGINVTRYRFLSVMVTGMIASVAGAYLSIATSNTFVEGMSAEKGYAAFAIIILGKYHPVGAFLGCLLYGFADALQLNLQAININVPHQILLMTPYVFTVIVMLLSGKGSKPEGHGKFFKKGSQTV